MRLASSGSRTTTSRVAVEDADLPGGQIPDVRHERLPGIGGAHARFTTDRASAAAPSLRALQVRQNR